MLLSLIILLLIGAITYFHYAQGLFAATVSAVCAGVAALMAFSYHEALVAGLTGGALAAYGNAVVLCALFALIYVVLRVIIDNFLPGNVRYPVMLDRIGAAVMGLFAAFFGTAIVAIAAQELPFGPTVMMYSPYPIETVDYNVPREYAAFYKIQPGDGAVNRNQLQIARLDAPEAKEQRSELWIPVDTWFLGLVGALSDNGALAGQRLATAYPDFKTAMYGHRLGMQRSARQMALNVAGRQEVSVAAVFRVNMEGEGAQFPEGIMQVPGDIEPGREVDQWLRPGPGRTLLVLRVKFGKGAADAGGFVRFSPATARLVIVGQQYYPIATLESGTVAVAAKPDDYLFAPNGADLVYEVDTASAIREAELASPAFLEFKRFARVDLGGQRLFSGITKSPTTHVLRKVGTIQFISGRLGNRNLDTRRSRDEFNQLRASVPDVEPDPDTAEKAARGLQGGDESQEPATEPAAGDAP